MTISNASAIYHKFHLKLVNIVPDTYLLMAVKRIEMFCVGYRKEAVLSNTDLVFVQLKKSFCNILLYELVAQRFRLP